MVAGEGLTKEDLSFTIATPQPLPAFTPSLADRCQSFAQRILSNPSEDIEESKSGLVRVEILIEEA